MKDLEAKYNDQINLRKTQIDFLEKGMTKLHRSMYSSYLASQMLDKKKALDELYDDNTNDLGKVMARKAQLEMHTEMLDRINALSAEIEMHQSNSIAKDLAKDIEKMQAEL